MPRYSIVAGGIGHTRPEWMIRLAGDGTPAEPTLPLSQIPGYPANQSPTLIEVNVAITTTLIQAGAIRILTTGDESEFSLTEHATLKVCAACHRWEHVDEHEEERLRRCSGCEIVWFCDEQCARAAWSNHKVGCRYEEAARLQIALEDHWEYFATLRPHDESARERVRSRVSDSAKLAEEVTGIRQNWHQVWPELLANALESGDWVSLCDHATIAHRQLEEKVVELFAADQRKDKAAALANEVRKLNVRLARAMMQKMSGIRETNAKMMELEARGVVRMRAKGLQYVFFFGTVRLP